MVIGCGSVGSNYCVASPNGFGYLSEGSHSLIASQHLVFPWQLVDDGWRDNICRSFKVVWEALAGFEFTLYWYSIDWKKSLLVMIARSAIDGISRCTVVHRLVPFIGFLFRMSRSCGHLGRRLGYTLEKFDLGTSFQVVIVACCLYHL
jgi:hypothetical protein